MRIAVTGAGGFIGGHLVKYLIGAGYSVLATDIKSIDEWSQVHPMATNLHGRDLRVEGEARLAVKRCDMVFNLAADMGGMGFIESHKADCMLSVLINTNLLLCALDEDVRRYLFASSACVYAADKQLDADVTALKEADAYPADAEDGYGWEKLFSERMCRHFREDYGLDTRIPRFHNVYGPKGTWDGGREKAPAAICRKVARAKLLGDHTIDIWGDGEQTRSFMYIDDCIEGIMRIMHSDYYDPINLGSSELVSINQLVDLTEEIAGFAPGTLQRTYDLSAPKGVRGRNSDNTLIREVLDWEPSISLREGMEKTYAWIYDQMR